MRFASVKTYLKLSRDEKQCFWRAFRALARVRVLLKTHGYQGTIKQLRLSKRSLEPTWSLSPEEISIAVRRASSLVPGAHCLCQSIVLYHLLEESGYSANIRIGVAPDNAGLDAHAWVEVDDKPLNEPEDVAKKFKASWNRHGD